jgi:hypothetical protein
MDAHLSLVNRIYEVVQSSKASIEHWGFFLYSPEFEDEPELRERLGTIWFCGLLDTIDASQRLGKLRQEAEAGGWPHLVESICVLQRFSGYVGEMLDTVSKVDQIGLVDWRNQLVHAFLASRHRDPITIKYYRGGRLNVEQVSRLDYANITGEFYVQYFSEVKIRPILNRLLHGDWAYWTAIRFLQMHGLEVYNGMRAGKTLRLP